MKICITTGGTGGHMYPAIATAKKFHEQGNTVYLFTDKRGVKWGDSSHMDTHMYAGTYAIPSRHVVGKSIAFKVVSLVLILWGTLITIFHMLRLRPDAVIGFGGYASVPVLFACVLLRIPIFLHEQNAYAGRVNRLFSRFAKRIGVSFKQTHGLDVSKCVYTGNPIRKDIADLYTMPYTPAQEKIHILITGGSQGAEIFGDIMPDVLSKYADKIHVVQQVRSTQIDMVKKAYDRYNIDADILPFIEDMPSALQSADIAIARSGAGTVMENACAGVPTIFVPYVYSADNHQYYNAICAPYGVVVEQTPQIQNLLQKQLDLLILDKTANKTRKTLFDLGKAFFVVDAEKKVFQMVQTYMKNGI